MSDSSISSEKKPNLFIRIAVIAGMLLILFFIAGSIVKYVPKIISSVSPANMSVPTEDESMVATSTGVTMESSPVSNTSTTNKPANTTPSAQTVAKDSTSTKTTSSSKKVASTNYNYYTYRGPADLSVSLTKVGQISGTSFIQTSSIQPGSRVQVQFLVTNTGGSASGPWSLNAVLPTTIANQKIYNSYSQPSIPAGSSYQMTLAFDAYDGSSNIQITISGTNDTNSSNNILIVPLTSSGYNFNNNCYWSNGYQYCNNNYNYSNNYNYNNNCYWVNGYNTCGNNYNNNFNYNNNGCYYQNGTYVCNNNYNNGCYWSGGFQYCNNNSYNNGCYWSNGYQYCTNNNSYSNNPDLSVTITNVGTMDRYTGQFYYSNGNTFNRNDKVAVQFTVTNIGSNTSGNWTYSASLPSSSNSNSSGTQSPIAPGQTANFVVGFDYPYSGSQNITVNIYPQSNDSNSGNNYASRTIYVNN